MHRIIKIWGILMCLPFLQYGQNTISGILTDQSTGEPLIGANVIVKGTSIGTATDLDGSFSFEIDKPAAELVFSYTGYADVTMVGYSGQPMKVSLSLGEVLNEVVVIGYGTIEREDATGSLQSVQAKDFNQGAITGPQELMAGKIAGVSITTSGDPGGGSTIRIRGESSLSATNDPLFVVDGIPLSNEGISGNRNPLNFINPNDIESITVLKDASATAIYGNRASGGVILITTKKGKVGEDFAIGYSANFSVGQPVSFIDVLDATEYRNLITELYGEGSFQDDLLGEADTDWQEVIFENAIGTDHTLTFRGSAGDIPLYTSIGYTFKDGILKTDNFNRKSFAVNLNPGFLDNALQTNFGIRYANEQNNFADRGAIGNALTMDPTQEVFDDTSPYGGYTTWTIANGNPNVLAPNNPLALLELTEDQSTVNRIVVNGSADYRIPFLPDLRANLNLGFDKATGSGSRFVPTNAAWAFDDLNGGGTNNVYEKINTNQILEFFLNYGKKFEAHNFNVMGGYSWQHILIEDSFTNSDVAGTPSETTTDSRPKENYLVSLFGRLNYDYNDRVHASFSLRRDGTSRFIGDNRYGLFPAAALAVKLIDNDLAKGLNLVKLRLGYGVTGQQDISSNWYPALANYQLSLPNAQYQFGNTFVSTYRPNGYDANLKWEETSTFNIGLDFSIISNKVTGSIDVYQRQTKDLLNFIPVPAGTNLTNFITTNVGDMEGSGIELSLNFTPIKTDDFIWELSTNAAFNQSKITKLTATEDPSYQGVAIGGISGGVGSTIQIHSVGFAPYSFYVFEQVYDEQGNIIEGEFVDRNGDGIVNDQDKYRYQQPTPDWVFGFNNYLAFKGFDLRLAARANIGNYVYNNIQTEMGWQNRVFNSTGALLNIHQSGLDNNALEGSNLITSDHFVREANFLRIDHITLGYTLKDILKNPIRIYASVQNPKVWTKYDGLDPEIYESNQRGLDNKIYPRARTFVFGINAEF